MSARAGAGMRLDHVVVRVSDLAQALADFSRAGFTVTAGGRHPAWNSENALVVFEDVSYLELIAFAPPARSQARETRGECMARLRGAGADLLGQRIGSWAAVTCGLVDYALRPTDIDGALRDLRARGFTVQGPTPGSRERADGERVAWRMGVPASLDLPFLCSDVTPPQLRMPEGAARRHANGARGVAELTLVNADPGRAAAALGGLLGQTPRADPSGGFTLHCVPCRLLLRAPRTDAERAHLAERGAGPVAVSLQAPGAAVRGLAQYGVGAAPAG